AAADLDRVADATGAGVAGALLAKHLASRAGDLAARLRADGALPLVGVVIHQRLLQQLRPNLAAKLGFIDLDRVDLLAGLAEYGDFNHDYSFASTGFSRAVMDLRTKRSPPFGPGRAPLISSRLLSLSILTSG